MTMNTDEKKPDEEAGRDVILEELDRIPKDEVLKELFTFSPEFEQFMEDLMAQKNAAPGAATEQSESGNEPDK